MLFGTRRLPALASAMGKTARAFRDALNGPAGDVVKKRVDEDLTGKPRR